jgi:excinuclease UvrABC nuclease subunit
MYKDKFFRSWMGPFPFTEAQVRVNAPSQSGVYQILYLGDLAYIGISTTSIFNRLLKHVRGNGNWAAARRMDPRGYQFVYYLCDGASAKEIESHMTVNHKPPFNVKTEYQNYIDNILLH